MALNLNNAPLFYPHEEAPNPQFWGLRKFMFPQNWGLGGLFARDFIFMQIPNGSQFK